MKRSVLAILFWTLSLDATAQNYLCEFSVGTQGSWAGPDISIDTISWTSGQVSVTRSQNDPALFIMRSELGEAQMTGTNSGFGVTFVGNHRGIPMFISVFDTPIPGTENYYAVLSRHAMIITSPQPTQYHGHCKSE